MCCTGVMHSATLSIEKLNEVKVTQRLQRPMCVVHCPPPRLGIDQPLSRHSCIEDGKTFRYRHITRGILIMAPKARTNRSGGGDGGGVEGGGANQTSFTTWSLPQELSPHFLWVWLRRLWLSCNVGMHYKEVLRVWNKRSPVVWL